MYMVKAKVDGKLAGIGRVVGDYSIVCCLSDICVKPEFHGRGIGLRIVKYLKNKIEEKSVCTYDEEQVMDLLRRTQELEKQKN